MENQNLNFKGGNPGAVQYGNFINYYQFHPPETRIKQLPQDLLRLKECNTCCALDIGCNTGDLTVALHSFLTSNFTDNCDITGIDIDPILIERAKETTHHKNVSFECVDVMKKNEWDIILRDKLLSTGKKKFDIIFCFSTTMWIHLNNGDDGLKKFLKQISEVSETLVIEPQPWKCYRTAVKRMKSAKAEFDFYKDIKMRKNIEDDIELYLTSQCNHKKIFESSRTEWGRKLLIFEQVNQAKH